MEALIALITQLVPGGQWLALLPTIVGILAFIAQFTPTDTDNKIVGILYKIIHRGGMNNGNAQNAWEILDKIDAGDKIAGEKVDLHRAKRDKKRRKRPAGPRH